MRWPGVIPAGAVSNEIVHHMDMLPTFLAAAGKSDIKTDLLDGYTSSALGRDYRVHLDGYNILEHLRDPDGVESPRKEIFYFSDTGDLTALRYADWKLIFLEQKAYTTIRAWIGPTSGFASGGSETTRRRCSPGRAWFKRPDRRTGRGLGRC